MAHHLLPEDLLSHAASMRRLARGLVIDEARAEDLVQEAFVAVAERRPPRPRSVGSWLRGMVRNLARHGRREETRRRRREELAARPESCPPSHAETLERVELERAVVESVLDLPEPYRGVVLARYFNDLQAADIAARDGVPVATVRTRLQRGLERLRRALDARHGGDRGPWRAVLLPLATVGAATTAGQASVSAHGAATSGATALPGAAAGAGASTTSSLVILGGTLLTQKTIAVAAAATLLSLVVGLGLGRYTAPLTPEDAKRRFHLVDAAAVEELEARLREAALAGAAANAKAEGEVAKLMSRIETLDAELKTASEAAPAAAPKTPAALAVAFGKFADLQALGDADWAELASALKEMNALFVESLDKQEQGEPIDDALAAKLAAATAKLSKFSMELMGKIPTSAAFNGEWTHPLVVSNLMGAMLEAAGVPLSTAQVAAIAGLGTDYERQYEENQGDYSESTPTLKKMLDEFELKQSFTQQLRAHLSPEQREEVLVPQLQDRLQDVLSPAAAAFFLVKSKSYASPEAAREQFQRSTIESLGLTAEQNAALGPAFAAWYEDVKPLLAAQKPTYLAPTLDAVLLAGRAHEGFLLRVLELPGLDAKTRAALLGEMQWTLPQVFEKEP